LAERKFSPSAAGRLVADHWRKSSWLPPRDITFFDIETTGLAETDRLIEIGAVRFRNGKFHSKFESLIHPGIPLPPEVSKLTGITSEMLST
jgi:DNA polymerase III epsilon subunit-like protein